MSELRHSELELDDVTLHVVEAGDPEAPPLLMLHGFPQFWWLWDHQLHGLSDEFRVVAPDMRGYNLSSRPQDTESYRMRHLLRDVAGLAEYVGGPFTLVGHDWGGIISWAFACREHPGLERLVILDAPPPWTWGRELERSPRQRQAVRYMVDLSHPAPHGEELMGASDFAVLDSLVLEPGLARGYLTQDDRARYHAAWGQPGALTGALNYYRASGMGMQVEAGQPQAIRDRLAEMSVDVPTLVIWGSEDNKLLPGLTQGLEEWVPDVRVELLEGAGHWTPQERPDEVNALIREFAGS